MKIASSQAREDAGIFVFPAEGRTRQIYRLKWFSNLLSDLSLHLRTVRPHCSGSVSLDEYISTLKIVRFQNTFPIPDSNCDPGGKLSRRFSSQPNPVFQSWERDEG